jgi:hypothetical protein
MMVGNFQPPPGAISLHIPVEDDSECTNRSPSQVQWSRDQQSPSPLSLWIAEMPSVLYSDPEGVTSTGA